MEPPEEEDQLVDEGAPEWSEHGEYTIGPEQATDQGEGGGEGATEAEDAGRALQVDVASPAGSAPASVSAQPEFHPGGGVDAKTLAWVLGAAGGYRDR